MKTLDEVIEALTICIKPDINRNCKDCPMPDSHGCMDFLMTDALQYLKWYKELADDSEAFAEWKENPPLTWDELQHMARKPIWVEWKNPRRIPRWWIVDLNEKPDPKDYLLAITTSGTNFEFLYKREQGDVWQAYRKERDDKAAE